MSKCDCCNTESNMPSLHGLCARCQKKHGSLQEAKRRQYAAKRLKLLAEKKVVQAAKG